MLARFRHAISNTTPDMPNINPDSAENWPSVVGLVDTEIRGNGPTPKVRSSFSAGYACASLAAIASSSGATVSTV